MGSVETSVQARLAAICGEAHVLSHPHDLATYRSDGLKHLEGIPIAVVLPGTAEEVQAIVGACHEAGLAWVARGAGTGLSGGAIPTAEGVLIVLSRLRRILEVDLADARVVAQPGVSNLAVSRAVAPTHFYPPDPSSQIVCSIGGNIAENAGGAHCFKYGFTTNYVTGLEVVLPDGSLAVLRRDDPGYDLLGAFVGSEGTLGIATRIELRVVPVPETVRTLVAFFADVADAGEAVSEVVSAGIIPGAIEMMDPLSIRAAEAATGAGYRLDAGAALLVELDGPREESGARLAELLALLVRARALDIRVALTAAEREEIWRARRAAFAAMGRIAPAYYVQDGVIPRTRLAEVLREIERLAADAELEVANVFHAGDGNLHPLVLYDAGRPGEPQRAEELAGAIVRACVDAGGSITGEHGVGLDKKRYMPAMFSEADLGAFQRLRCAFDPLGRANPGKVMPTPRLCGEVPGPYRAHPLERAGIAERF
ncbi:MAG TPA: FAD-linked oxidase C-terminal domain-containing protein [Solirubrobacteraceae bacterium]|nr:FAD-linked oxidase C-terminal domain-containing protein [Solirubrobacteraceae bacterium]